MAYAHQPGQEAGLIVQRGVSHVFRFSLYLIDLPSAVNLWSFRLNANMEKVLKVIEDVITNPPIPHEPHKQSLKNWAMYCLRDRGFIVVFAQNADFAVQFKTGEKFYFKVTNQVNNLDNDVNWIVWDAINKKTSLIRQF
jgi:hypothetical protein